jgi:hypothetical protein
MRSPARSARLASAGAASASGFAADYGMEPAKWKWRSYIYERN